MIVTRVDFPRTRRSARAVAEALFSSDDGPPPAVRLDWLMDEVADLLRCAGLQSRALFQLGLLLVSWLAPLWIFALPPLRRLPLAARVRALSRMEENPAFASLILACKAILCMVYFEDPEAARTIAADEPCTPARRRLPVVDALTPIPLPRVGEAPQVNLDRGGAA